MTGAQKGVSMRGLRLTEVGEPLKCKASDIVLPQMPGQSYILGREGSLRRGREAS